MYRERVCTCGTHTVYTPVRPGAQSAPGVQGPQGASPGGVGTPLHVLPPRRLGRTPRDTPGAPAAAGAAFRRWCSWGAMRSPRYRPCPCLQELSLDSPEGGGHDEPHLSPQQAPQPLGLARTGRLCFLVRSTYYQSGGLLPGSGKRVRPGGLGNWEGCLPVEGPLVLPSA